MQPLKISDNGWSSDSSHIFFIFTEIASFPCALLRFKDLIILKSGSHLPKKLFLFALMTALQELWKMLFISS